MPIEYAYQLRRPQSSGNWGVLRLRPQPRIVPTGRSTNVGSSSSSAPKAPFLSGPRVSKLRSVTLRAQNHDSSGTDGSTPGDEDDELNKLLGLGRYRGSGGGLGSNSSSIFESGSDAVPSHAGPDAWDGPSGSSGGDGSSELQETLADIMQMEIRRVRVKEEVRSDIEDRKEQMRQIGEEMKAALARDYELDRMRTEMGASFAMSEALQALDDVEAEVQRIKQELQADKAELAAWEEKTAEERSRGLFFKSLYATDKEPRQPVGKSIPGYWRKQREAAAAAAAAAAEAVEAAAGATEAAAGADPADADAAAPSASSSSASASASASASSAASLPSTSHREWDPEEVAAAAERPLSAASRQVRSPLRLYLFSYLSAFLALLVINDIASSGGAADGGSSPHVLRDWVCGLLSAGLGFVAVKERQAMSEAQDAMLEGIRRTGGRRDGGAGQAGSGSGSGGGGAGFEGHRRRRR